MLLFLNYNLLSIWKLLIFSAFNHKKHTTIRTHLPHPFQSCPSNISRYTHSRFPHSFQPCPLHVSYPTCYSFWHFINSSTHTRKDRRKGRKRKKLCVCVCASYCQAFSYIFVKKWWLKQQQDYVRLVRKGKEEAEEGEGKRKERNERERRKQYSMSLEFAGLHVKLDVIIQTVVGWCYIGIGGEGKRKERKEEKKRREISILCLEFAGLHVKLVFIIQTVVWLCYVGIGGEETRKERKKWRETRQRKLYYTPPTVWHLLIYHRSGDPNSSRAG